MCLFGIWWHISKLVASETSLQVVLYGRMHTLHALAIYLTFQSFHRYEKLQSSLKDAEASVTHRAGVYYIPIIVN